MTSWTPQLRGRDGPLYRVIADALAADIDEGRLAPGTRLPTHRELAETVGVTVGTVTRAYAEAERRGLIGGEVGRGTFVRHREAASPPPHPRAGDGR
ncbi:GntR family transcriptional regulator [Pyxidicoccus sp. 3LFB2]